MSEQIENLLTDDNVERTLPAISTDLDRFDAELEQQLDQFRVVLADGQVAEGKKMATAVNKLAGNIDQVRKDIVRELSAPIKEWDEALKKRVARAKEVRQEILDQVEKHEAEVRQKAEKAIGEYTQDLREEKGIESRYQNETFEDLVKPTSLTKTGQLNQATKRIIDARVTEELSVQQNAEMRVLRLEQRCRDAGLEEPLGEEHVQHLLKLSQAEYEDGVDKLIAAEIRRQENARKRREEEEQRRKAAEEAQAEADRTREQRAQTKPREPEPASKPGKLTVTATFEIDDPGASDSAIEQALTKRMQEAGFHNLTSVSVIRGVKRAA